VSRLPPHTQTGGTIFALIDGQNTINLDPVQHIERQDHHLNFHFAHERKHIDWPSEQAAILARMYLVGLKNHATGYPDFEKIGARWVAGMLTLRELVDKMLDCIVGQVVWQYTICVRGPPVLSTQVPRMSTGGRVLEEGV